MIGKRRITNKSKSISISPEKPKFTKARQMRPKVSPTQGVPPPPEDLQFPLKKDPDSSEIIDPEAQNIISKTKLLSKEIHSKLNEYKSSNKLHLEKKQGLLNQVNSYKAECQSAKESFGEVIKEAFKTKEELRTMREQMESDSYSDIEIPKTPVSADIIGQLVSLKNSIEIMSNKLHLNELELKEKNCENEALKQNLFKIKEAIISQTILEENESDPKCQVCSII